MRVGVAAVERGLVPAQIRNDPVLRLSLWKWFLTGLLLRFAIMPFAASVDLMAVYWRGHQVAYHGVLFVPYSGLFLMDWLHGLFLLLLRPFLPQPELFFTHQWPQPVPTPEIGLEALTIAFQHPNTFQYLFLLKLPYLAFDLAAGFLLLRCFESPSQSLRAFRFWMVNLVAVYAAYVIGRYEVIPVLFITVALLLLRRGHPIGGAAAYVIGLPTRFSMLILAPLFVFAAWKPLVEIATRNRRSGAIVGAAAGVAIVLAVWLDLPAQAVFASLLPTATTTLYSMSFTLRADLPDIIYIFLLAYFLLMWSFVSGRRPDARRVVAYGLSSLLLMFALSSFHPNYFAWIAPFMAFYVATERRYAWMYAVMTAAFFAYIWLWPGPNNVHTLVPIAPELVTRLRPVTETISEWYPAERLLNSFRTLFSATALWMVWSVLREEQLRDLTAIGTQQGEGGDR